MSEDKKTYTFEDYDYSLCDLLDSVYDYIDARDELEDLKSKEPNNLPAISDLINEVDVALDDVYKNGKIFREIDKVEDEDDTDDVEDTDDEDDTDD